MFSKRIGILFGGIAVVFCALVARLFQLQIAQQDGSRSAGLAEERTIALPAARGAILDRDSRLLRATRDAFDVHVTGPIFRERNLVDALADLMVLLSPGPAFSAPIERGRLVQELRGKDPEPAIARILALDPAAALTDESDDLHGRAHILIEPEGTLVRPSSHVRRRVQDAILVLAGNGGPAPREIRKRLRDRGVSVGSATGATAADLVERIRREDFLLARVGAELGLGEAGEVRAVIDQLCDRHFRRVEAEIERRVDDAICLQHYGSWNLDPARLSDEEVADLRKLAGAPGTAPWAAVRAALCRQIRTAPGFERSRYLDARKENQTKTELATFRGDELGCGGSFALAGIVDGPFGLRAMGFDLHPSFARDEARRQGGAALALLLGDVTRRNTPTGGVEERLDSVLRGEPGEARVAPDGIVTVVRPPRHGRNVNLTISLLLQEKIQALADHLSAVAVVDVRTGGILAAATWPLPAEGEESSAIAELTDLKGKGRDLRARVRAGDEAAEPLLAAVRSNIIQSPGVHRAVTSENNVPPGSVMKTLTLLAGLEAGVINPAFEIDCQTLPHPVGGFGCHHHGRIDLEGAIERSCNEYCYQTVALLGGSRSLFALYEKVGLFDEVQGLIGPAMGAYMREAIREDVPKNLAIGQGSFSLPPVRVAGLAASLATGRAVHPHLYAPDGFQAIGPSFASESNLAVIRSGMWRVVVGVNGTAAKRWKQALEPLGIAGKTGTAQLATRNEEELYAAWFVGFAPHDAPRYAFAVLLDRTHEEGADTAPAAAHVVDACYAVLGGRP